MQRFLDIRDLQEWRVVISLLLIIFAESVGLSGVLHGKYLEKHREKYRKNIRRETMECYIADRDNSKDLEELFAVSFGKKLLERPEPWEMALVGIEDGNYVGFAALDMGGVTPVLKLLYITPEYRGQGKGRELLLDVILFLRWRNISGLSFEERVSWLYGPDGRRHLDRVAAFFENGGFFVTKWYDRDEITGEKYLVVSGNMPLTREE